LVRIRNVGFTEIMKTAMKMAWVILIVAQTFSVDFE